MAHRIAALARLASAQGLVAVVATISLFHEVHAASRAGGADYFEVLLDCEPQVRTARRALYGDASQGARVGVEIVPEFPRAPHLALATDTGEPIAQLARTLVGTWESRGV